MKILYFILRMITILCLLIFVIGLGAIIENQAFFIGLVFMFTSVIIGFISLNLEV